MSAKVIQALRASTLAASLTEVELRALTSCGRLQQNAAGKGVLPLHLGTPR
jgi:hypothetical protein